MIRFNLDINELSKLEQWDNDHKCELKEYSGAIGGRLTFSFTPTGLGVVTKVKCGCGEEIDLTEYNDW